MQIPSSDRFKFRKGCVLLKILLVEASGSKLMKFDRCFTVRDAILRIGKSLKIEKRALSVYRLFIPLGAPLDDTAVLGDLELKNHDVFEFKKLPPHLIQLYSSNKPSTPAPAIGSGENFPANILDWNCEIVCLWLTKIGYGEIVLAFREKNITGETLFSLTNERLRDGKSLVNSTNSIINDDCRVIH